MRKGFMQLAKISPPNRVESPSFPFWQRPTCSCCVAAGQAQVQSDYGKITGYAEDSENCRPSTERPMQLGPLFDTQSDCSGKVKPKVELRGSIMALSNTGGRRIPGPLMGAEKNGKDDAFAGVGKYDI